MNTKIRAKITALGAFVPPRVLSNNDLEKMVATTNEWILERTGIRERHLVDKGVAASDLAVGAARDYAETVEELVRRPRLDGAGVSGGLAVQDAHRAADVLRPGWEATGGRAGYVGIEVSPRLRAESITQRMASAMRRPGRTSTGTW